MKKNLELKIAERMFYIFQNKDLIDEYEGSDLQLAKRHLIKLSKKIKFNSKKALEEYSNHRFEILSVTY